MSLLTLLTVFFYLGECLHFFWPCCFSVRNQLRSVGALEIDLRGEAGRSTVEPGQQLRYAALSWAPSYLLECQGPNLCPQSQDSHRMSGPFWLGQMYHEASAVSTPSRNVVP